MSQVKTMKIEWKLVERKSLPHMWFRNQAVVFFFPFFFLNQLYELRGLSCISKGCGGTARLRCWAVAYLARSQPLFSTTEDISTYLIHTFLNISPTLVHIRLYSIKFIKVHSYKTFFLLYKWSIIFKISKTSSTNQEV